MCRRITTPWRACPGAPALAVDARLPNVYVEGHALAVDQMMSDSTMDQMSTKKATFTVVVCSDLFDGSLLMRGGMEATAIALEVSKRASVALMCSLPGVAAGHQAGGAYPTYQRRCHVQRSCRR